MRHRSPRCATLMYALTILAIAAPPAFAILPSPQADPYNKTASDLQYAYIHETAQHAPSQSYAERAIEELGGDWRVYLWNQYSNTARQVYGTGIDLVPGGIQTAAQAEAASRAFITAHPDLFGGARTENLVRFRVTNALGKWAVLLQQTVHGIPVEDAYIHLLFTESGRLYVFGSNYYSGISVPPVPTIDRDFAVQIARAAVPYDAESEIQSSPDRTAILPVLDVSGGEGVMRFHVVHVTDVPSREPYGLYRTFVDAQNGDIVRRENQTAEAYSGVTQGDVEIPTYCAGNTPNSRFMRMNVAITGIGTVVSDSLGNFSVPGNVGTTTFNAQFDGPVTNVNCSTCGGDAMLNGNITPDVPLTINFPSGTYRADERDCFYFINKTYDFVRSIDPTWTIGKHTSNVNLNATCNANWSPGVMNFFRTGNGCHNTGEIGDVMGHEFGHGIQNSLLGGQGQQGLGEGNGDISGTFVINGSLIGQGFNEGDCINGLSCPGSACRDCENVLQYPGAVVGQPIHSAGRVICGFNWDTRQALESSMGTAAGKAHCAKLWHFSRKMFGTTSMTQPDQVLHYFTIDDNDGNLGNGTPHYTEICGGATNHGFSCPTISVGVFITHTPLALQTSTVTPYPVAALITSTAGALNSDSLLTYYRVGGVGAYTKITMTATGNPNEFSANIPAQPCGSTVEYYITARDVANNFKASPATAPASVYSFGVVDNLLYSQTFESASDWTTDPSHNALTGAFVRVDPVATGFQPGDDTTPPTGVNAWITAQNAGGADGTDDVDSGIAATRSPVFNLSTEASAHLSMKYFFGQRDNGGDPSGDFFRLQLSSDGGTSYPVTLVSYGDVPVAGVWQSLEVDLEDYITLTSTVRIRVQASDGTTTGDIVEAGIDDIYISTCDAAAADTTPPSVTVTDPDGGEVFVIGNLVPITWNATDDVGVTGVDVYYSKNSGGLYDIQLVANGPNTGSFSWNSTGNMSTDEGRIKVVARDAAANEAEDASNANFILGPAPSAPPTALLLSPNGGESVDAQSSALVTWNAGDDVAVTEVDLELSLDGGATYPVSIATGLANTGSFVWSVYDSATASARIRVVAHDGNYQTTADGSDANFTITMAATGVGTPAIPSKAFVGANIPEPFTEITTVRFGLPRSASVDLAVYSAEGRMVRRLASGVIGAGTWEKVWDGRDENGTRVTSGRYFLKLSTPDSTVTHRMTLIR